jgi:hypothetical protein
MMQTISNVKNLTKTPFIQTNKDYDKKLNYMNRFTMI